MGLKTNKVSYENSRGFSLPTCQCKRLTLRIRSWHWNVIQLPILIEVGGTHDLRGTFQSRTERIVIRIRLEVQLLLLFHAVDRSTVKTRVGLVCWLSGLHRTTIEENESEGNP